MSSFDVELVGKIGSMALIRKEDNDIDYNIFARIGAELHPGIIWISSGATEIGRLDYMKRNSGHELDGSTEEAKTDYAAQGQAILMENYRRFVSPMYSLRQLLVEHQHFNDPNKREYIRQTLLRCPAQNAIPIVNYNDPVSYDENRKMELNSLKKDGRRIVECIDNDETAAVISSLVKSRLLVILTSVDGIYADPANPSTLISDINGKNAYDLADSIREAQTHCFGASRDGAHGAHAKLEYAMEPAMNGTTVIIGNAKYNLKSLIDGTAPRTQICIR